MGTLKETIQSKTRAEWYQFLRERATDVRIWMQEHGEKGAAIAFAIGVCVVLFFKLFMLILVLAVIAGYGVWYLAPEE